MIKIPSEEFDQNVILNLIAGVGPCDPSQPGPDEHGREPHSGFRKASVSPPASAMSSRSIRQPTTALSQARGTYVPSDDVLNYTVKLRNATVNQYPIRNRVEDKPRACVVHVRM